MFLIYFSNRRSGTKETKETPTGCLPKGKGGEGARQERQKTGGLRTVLFRGGESAAEHTEDEVTVSLRIINILPQPAERSRNTKQRVFLLSPFEHANASFVRTHCTFIQKNMNGQTRALAVTFLRFGVASERLPFVIEMNSFIARQQQEKFISSLLSGGGGTGGDSCLASSDFFFC